MLTALAFKLDSLGFRPLIAKTASLVYPNQSFSVDASGNWVNKQDECTIVSPTIHTSTYAALREWVLHHWAYCYTPQAGDILVDLGTGIGEEAVIFSPMIGASGCMYAVEAQPTIFACLQRTVECSGLQNVRAVHCAVADVDGETKISDGPVHLANSILAGGSITVPQRSLDSLVREWGLERIDFLRLNIEGAERLAIPGMTDAIQKVRNVAISCHDFCGLPSKADVLGFLSSSGFKITTRDPEPNAPWIGDYLYGSR